MESLADSAVLPVSDAEADACLQLLSGMQPLLAVSGGVDSMALMGLASAWARRRGAAIHVAVVDHGLRDGSASEAAFVLAEAARLGLRCAALRWDGTKPAAGLQEAARAARYGLLAAHARAVGADTIVTAHTLDDQAETLMMRLAAGSGPAGMAGMLPAALKEGVAHIRPFLDLPKDRLTATCRARGWRWLEDPSNANLAFARVRWRALMPLLAREGLTAARLAQFARRMAETEIAMQQMTDALLRSCGHRQATNGWEIDARALFAHPDALVVRVFAALLQPEVGENRSSHRLQLGRLEAFAAAMRAALASETPLTRTLGGSVLSLKRDGSLVCRPEPPRHRGCVNPVHSPSLGNGLPEN